MTRRIVFLIIGLSVALGMNFATPSAQAQSTNSWTAQYFNNTTLSGSPFATATLGNLSLNWGQNAPVTGMAADDWTARFNTITYFNTGTYRFTVHADDAFRLYVHNQLLVDTFNNPRPDQAISVDMAITAGNGGVQLDFREYYGPAFLHVSWQQLGTPNTPSAPAGAWSAQYFNNTTLSGTPNAVGSLTSLNINWGNGSPINGIIADNWTARFVTTPNLNAGNYRFSINADDAFRLYVQNRLIYDTFNDPRPDVPFTFDVAVSGGSTAIQVDYRDYTGPAFVYLNWQPITGNQQPVPSSTEPRITVNTASLNVRSAPVIGDNIVTRISRNTTHTVVGRTAASDWYQIRVGQGTGWVSARYVIPSNTANVAVVTVNTSVPNAPATPTGFTLRANANVNIRSGAGTNHNRIGILPYNTTATILARNSNNSWWMVRYDTVTGWVFGGYIILPWNIDYARVPVR